jgi:hypothetical protein
MAIIVGLTASMAWAMGDFANYYFAALRSLSSCFTQEENFKVFLKNEKEIGICFENDPDRKITFRKDIYQLAYTLCLKQDELEEILEQKNLHCLPLQTQINEVFIAALICAASVIFCGTGTAVESIKNEKKITYISWEL